MNASSELLLRNLGGSSYPQGRLSNNMFQGEYDGVWGVAFSFRV